MKVGIFLLLIILFIFSCNDEQDRDIILLDFCYTADTSQDTSLDKTPIIKDIEINDPCYKDSLGDTIQFKFLSNITKTFEIDISSDNGNSLIHTDVTFIQGNNTILHENPRDGNIYTISLKSDNSNASLLFKAE